MEYHAINLIGFKMEQALGTMSAKLASALLREGIDLPHSQYGVLRVIYSHNEPLTQIRIAEKLKKDAAAIKRTVDILERKGLVEREAQSGRSNQVLATEKAMQLKATITGIADKILHEIFDKFNEKELEVFVSVLDRIGKNNDKEF